jgi:hypothetical protein
MTTEKNIQNVEVTENENYRNKGLQNVIDWHRGVEWAAEQLEDLLDYKDHYRGINQRIVEARLRRLLQTIKNEKQAIEDARQDYNNGFVDDKKIAKIIF